MAPQGLEPPTMPAHAHRRPSYLDVRMAAKPRTCVVWFRQDLRLRDHSALVQASSFDRCILLFVWDDRWSEHIGGAAQVFIREALRNLHRHVADRYGQCLVFRRGDAAEVVCKLMVQAQATTLLASRSYEPWLQEVDATVRQALPPDTDFQDFPGYLLYEPAAVTALNPQVGVGVGTAHMTEG